MLFKYSARDVETVIADNDGNEIVVMTATDYTFEVNIDKLGAEIEALVAKLMGLGDAAQ